MADVVQRVDAGVPRRYDVVARDREECGAEVQPDRGRAASERAVFNHEVNVVRHLANDASRSHGDVAEGRALREVGVNRVAHRVTDRQVLHERAHAAEDVHPRIVHDG